MKFLSYKFQAAGVLAAITVGCVSLEGVPTIERDASDGEVSESTDGDSGAVESDAGSDSFVDAEIEPPLEPDAESPGEDASALPGRLDGGSLPLEDAAADAITLPPVPMACATDAQCAANELCGPDEVCMPRCRADGPCVVASSKRGIGALGSDGKAVYWALNPVPDSVGNPGGDGEIWRMEPGHAPKLIVAQMTHALFKVQGEYVYFAKGRALHRMPIARPSTSQYLYAFPGNAYYWDVGRDFVAFGTDKEVLVGALDGSTPLRSVWTDPHPMGEVIRIFAREGKVYFHGATTADPLSNTTYYLHAVAVNGGPTTVETLFTYSFLYPHSYSFEVRPPYLFKPEGWGSVSPNPSRYDMRDGSSLFVAGVANQVCFGSAAVLVDDWVYWYFDQGLSEVNRSHSTITRSSFTKVGVQQVLLPLHTYLGEPAGPIAVAGDHLYFVRQTTKVLYEMPLPPAPCAADLPCAPGKSCGSDSLCH